jgi:hypothetical protein
MTITPINPVNTGNGQPIYAQAIPNDNYYGYTAEQMGADINNVINSFPNEVPPQTEKEQKARKTITDFMNYIKSDKFKSDVHNSAQKYRLPEREVATNFITKVLGTIGDIAGIVVNTVRGTAHTIVDLLSAVLNGAVDVICNVANSLVRLVTLNKTCVA